VINRLASVTIYVDDQEKALAFYTQKLGFAKISDVRVPGGMRWLTVAPTPTSETTITLEDTQDSDRAKTLPKRLGVAPRGCSRQWTAEKPMRS
jgi:catechol 2,3-dioxygenase-like lactoylglutathione lyase family enzyme